MTPKEQAEAQHDPLHEDMIRNRRRIAPGHWSNSDIDCLLRRLDEARTAAADARRQAIEEVAVQYHDALADFFESEWRREPLMGFAEEHFKKAKRHRSYSKEIREQVWTKADALLPPAPEEGG